MDYNGDTDEYWEANKTLCEHLHRDELSQPEQFIAADYFQWGWEAAMEFVKKQKGQS